MSLIVMKFDGTSVGSAERTQTAASLVKKCDEVPIRPSSVTRRSLLAKVEGVVFLGRSWGPRCFRLRLRAATRPQ
jgi:hypothetical protein